MNLTSRNEKGSVEANKFTGGAAHFAPRGRPNRQNEVFQARSKNANPIECSQPSPAKTLKRQPKDVTSDGVGAQYFARCLGGGSPDSRRALGRHRHKAIL